MRINFLHFNERRTNFIRFGKYDSCDTLSLLAPYSHVAVKNVGVIFNRFLKMDQQKTVITPVCFYQLRVTEVKPYLLQKELKKKVLHAFITCRLDYFNFGVEQLSLSLVQNVAARLLIGVKKHEHITTALRSSNQMILSDPETRLKQGGGRASASTAPDLQNNTPIPRHSCTAQTLHTCKSLLKHLFSSAPL